MSEHAHYVEGAEGASIQPGCTLGLRYREPCAPLVLGAGARIRTGTIIYADVVIGDGLQTGHHVLIREHTRIGDHVVVGTNSVIEGEVEIGDFVKIESLCFIPTHVTIGSRVFIGPNVVLTNDRYPLRQRENYHPEPTVIEDNVSFGAGVVVCPGVRIGAGAFIGAGAVVTRDVPPATLVVGNPGRHAALPDKLREPNMALSWRRFLEAPPS